MDATYQNQLKETNELNWERFKATLQAECAAIRGELRAEFRAGLADVRGELRAGLADLRAEFTAALSQTSEEQRSEVSKLRIEMGAMRGDLLKWMFIYWSGSMVALLGGLAVGLVKLGLR